MTKQQQLRSAVVVSRVLVGDGNHVQLPTDVFRPQQTLVKER